MSGLKPWVEANSKIKSTDRLLFTVIEPQKEYRLDIIKEDDLVEGVQNFITISPTHVKGEKRYAWSNFKNGNYIAIGWNSTTDFTGWDIDAILKKLESEGWDNIAQASNAYSKFFKIKPGDIVGVTNSNHSLLGIGVVTSGYRFQQNIHDAGNNKDYYSHLFEVIWI